LDENNINQHREGVRNKGKKKKNEDQLYPTASILKKKKKKAQMDLEKSFEESTMAM